MLARRMLFFAAILLLLATFAAAMAPRQPLPPPPPSAQPERPDVAGTVSRRISAGDGAATAVRVRRGDILRLEVAGNVLDSVLLDGLDRIEAIEPRTPAVFELLAEWPGTYPIRLIAADRRIGRLVIRP